MITNITKLEVEFDGRKYVLYCDSDSPIEHVRAVLGSMSDKLKEVLDQQVLEAKKKQEQELSIVEELKTDCCKDEQQDCYCNGKTLC